MFVPAKPWTVASASLTRSMGNSVAERPTRIRKTAMPTVMSRGGFGCSTAGSIRTTQDPPPSRRLSSADDDDAHHAVVLVPGEMADERVEPWQLERHDRGPGLEGGHCHLRRSLVVDRLGPGAVALVQGLVADDPLVVDWILVDEDERDRYAVGHRHSGRLEGRVADRDRDLSDRRIVCRPARRGCRRSGHQQRGGRHHEAWHRSQPTPAGRPGVGRTRRDAANTAVGRDAIPRSTTRSVAAGPPTFRSGVPSGYSSPASTADGRAVP